MLGLLQTLPFAVLISIILVVALGLKRRCGRYHPVFMNLDGKHVLITGASSGIGLELSRICAMGGSKVTLVARDEARLNSAVESVQLSCTSHSKPCGNLTGISCDVSGRYLTISEMVNKAVISNGPIDILICNAGICIPGELVSTDPSSFKQTFDTNLLGPCLLTRAAIPHLSRPARVVFVSSQAGQIGIYGYSSYAASKFGLAGFAQSIQMELFTNDVNVTIAYPPDTDTPGHEQELETRSGVSNAIAGKSGKWGAQEVASGIIKAAQRGSFSCTFGLNGIVLNAVSGGASPIFEPIHAIAKMLLSFPSQLFVYFSIGEMYDLVASMTERKSA